MTLKVLPLLFVGVSSLASAQANVHVPAVRSSRRALAAEMEPAPDTDVNAVEIRARGAEIPVVALMNLQVESGVDIHRGMHTQVRRAERYSLCETPCRLVINQPLLLSVGEIEIEVAPQAQRQRWLFIPPRRGLQIGARVVLGLGLLSTLIGLVYRRLGAATRAGLGETDLDGDAAYRGGLAGIVLGTSMFIAGTTCARLWRGRVTRVY